LQKPERRVLAQRIAAVPGVKPDDIAELLHISRQMVYRYLKENKNERRADLC
jgi:predicted transcriptional regulator